MATDTSQIFAFLERHDPALARLATLAELPIPIPPEEEMLAATGRIKDLLTRAEHLKARYTAVADLRPAFETSVLSVAFRGELVPQDPNDEPASVLLERICAARSAPAARPSTAGDGHAGPQPRAKQRRKRTPSEDRP